MRMPWTKKPDPEPSVTLEDIIQSWPLFLAAGGTPSLEWFMALDLDVQEALADIGMRFREARDLELGAAIADPKLAQVVMDSEDSGTPTEAAASVLQHVLADAASRALGGDGASTRPSAAPTTPASAAPSWDSLGGSGQVVNTAAPQRKVALPGGDR